MSETDAEPPQLQRFDMRDGDLREEGLATASLAVRRGELVVLPTDTVYGIGCDAFEPESVQALLDAKGRGRDMPPPVLISAVTTLDALASSVPEWARVLADSYWPGPLTLVCPQQESLQWDLGETRGTVAVRMPDHDVALDLIQRTGPLAVSSANSTGEPAATDADAAERMLGSSLSVLLDAGPTAGEQPSTILDCTGERPRVLREGALSLADIRATLTSAGTSLDEGPEEGQETGAGA
ncbi:threonylcarbamoyl-AMP synthase [Marmoricola endophyticus]|uniref:L-threonylcarbamoyladenylate synthase n=1 Tax=Marmoricola endophyticus TaxID=2040280 RepID=A0A917BFW1_9ACTN|nr:L-threonylcarbamoyladenylate synthase [Marmoricola endophyticus]GGF41000.1 threonylcarbamoyl-AMP synthase [Marmoricola endophyticus]